MIRALALGRLEINDYPSSFFVSHCLSSQSRTQMCCMHTSALTTHLCYTTPTMNIQPKYYALTGRFSDYASFHVVTGGVDCKRRPDATFKSFGCAIR